MSNYDEAKAAKQSLREKLLKDFSIASSGLVSGIGLGNDSTADYHVEVMLGREPTTEEKKHLPETYMGVEVKYKIVGPIRAF